MMKQLMGGLTAVLVVGLTACTDSADRSSQTDTGAVPTQEQEQERVTDVQTDTSEIGEAGEAGKVEKGSADVDTSKTVTTTETDVKKDSESLPTLETKSVKADINKMSEKEFMALGFSKPQADSIVKYRKEKGDFKSVDDLKSVPGMDMAKLNMLSGKLGATPAG